MKIAFFVLMLVLSFAANADSLKPFTTDGCSMFPDGNMNDDSKWGGCCIAHDMAYWKGGTRTERTQADEALRDCVASTGEEELSMVMYLGVTFGGAPIYPTWYRWGYGWPYNRGYKQLTAEEKKQVKQKLIELKNLVDKALKDTE